MVVIAVVWCSGGGEIVSQCLGLRIARRMGGKLRFRNFIRYRQAPGGVAGLHREFMRITRNVAVIWRHVDFWARLSRAAKAVGLGFRRLAGTPCVVGSGCCAAIDLCRAPPALRIRRPYIWFFSGGGCVGECVGCCG